MSQVKLKDDNKTNKRTNKHRKLKIILASVILFLSLSTLVGTLLVQSFPDMYSNWLKNTPEYVGKTSTTKKTTELSTLSAPVSEYDKLKALTSTSLAGLKFHGTLLSERRDVNINVGVYSDPRSTSWISNELLNTANAGMHYNQNADDPEHTNITLAAHTYIGDGYSSKAFTPLQYKTNVGDVFYYIQNNKVYTYKIYKNFIVSATDGGYILNPDRWEDKTVNPDGKGMMTLYDCNEPYDQARYNPDPPNRNVYLMSLQSVQDYSDFEKSEDAKAQSLTKRVPQTVYDEKTKTYKLKNTSRKGNLELRFEDFLFETVKLQNIIGTFVK